MRPFIQPSTGATFYLGNPITLMFRKDYVEYIFKLDNGYYGVAWTIPCFPSLPMPGPWTRPRTSWTTAFVSITRYTTVVRSRGGRRGCRRSSEECKSRCF